MLHLMMTYMEYFEITFITKRFNPNNINNLKLLQYNHNKINDNKFTMVT